MKFRWYVLNVYAGYEKRVSDAIYEQAAKKGLSPFIKEILVPSEEVVEVKKGKAKQVEKNYFPGYVLIQMAMSDEAWHMVRSVNRVAGFVGTKNKPTAISEAEVKRILKQVEEALEQPRFAVTYDIGDNVKVLEGPFASFNGVIEEIDHEKNRLKVFVTIFGRPTPVELEYTQVEKL
jgi:transcriptional antiterminator NusG